MFCLSSCKKTLKLTCSSICIKCSYILIKGFEVLERAFCICYFAVVVDNDVPKDFCVFTWSSYHNYLCIFCYAIVISDNYCLPFVEMIYNMLFFFCNLSFPHLFKCHEKNVEIFPHERLLKNKKGNLLLMLSWKALWILSKIREFVYHNLLIFVRRATVQDHMNKSLLQYC